MPAGVQALPLAADAAPAPSATGQVLSMIDSPPFGANEAHLKTYIQMLRESEGRSEYVADLMRFARAELARARREWSERA